MESDDDLLNFITEKLNSALSLADETYSEYIAQLALDEAMPNEEKKSIICEFLQEATDQDIDVVVTEVLNQATKLMEHRRDKETNQKQIEMAKAKEVEQQSLVEELSNAENSAKSAKSQMTKEERRKRDQLLKTYGWDVDEIVENENGEAEILYKGASSTSSNIEAILPKNDNASRVKEAELNKRAKMQAEHTAKVQRDKAALEKQLADKEKEKRRTQKKEKRRM
ncbi:hypothetical protein HDU76_006013 [Blyttiomyces sp. JEL0837]|nr:hypothetical protein HDU76_006013 [Blyttiomyces sp. JEL0837]